MREAERVVVIPGTRASEAAKLTPGDRVSWMGGADFGRREMRWTGIIVGLGFGVPSGYVHDERTGQMRESGPRKPAAWLFADAPQHDRHESHPWERPSIVALDDITYEGPGADAVEVLRGLEAIDHRVPTSHLYIAGAVAFTLTVPSRPDGSPDIDPGQRKRIVCVWCSNEGNATILVDDMAPEQPTRIGLNRSGQTIDLAWSDAGWVLALAVAA